MFDLLAWTPVFGIDLATGSDLHARQADQLGRAIAWQAAHVRQNPALSTLDGRERSSVSVGSFSESYREGHGAPTVYPARVRALLARSGLLAEGLTGRTSRRRADDEDRIIPVIP